MITICKHPVVSDRINKLRDVATSPAQFRAHLRQVAIYLTYEATKNLSTKTRAIETPIETVDLEVLSDQSPVLVSILRAGNGLLDGALDVLPDAHVGFLGMYRDEETLKPVNYYSNIPSELGDRPVIVLDPMLATGNSARDGIKQLREMGAKDVRLLCLVAAPEGIATIQEFDESIDIFCGVIDRGLNEKGYIVPGLGDAGDRIFNSSDLVRGK